MFKTRPALDNPQRWHNLEQTCGFLFNRSVTTPFCHVSSWGGWVSSLGQFNFVRLQEPSWLEAAKEEDSRKEELHLPVKCWVRIQADREAALVILLTWLALGEEPYFPTLCHYRWTFWANPLESRRARRGEGGGGQRGQETPRRERGQQG